MSRRPGKTGNTAHRCRGGELTPFEFVHAILERNGQISIIKAE